MILEFDQLKQYRGTVAMVDGAFDPLHHGHIEYFRLASEQLEVPLLCNVASDRYVRTKRPPLLSEEHRAAVVDAIRYISYTHINRHDTETILRSLRGRLLSLDDDTAVIPGHGPSSTIGDERGRNPFLR